MGIISTVSYLVESQRQIEIYLKWHFFCEAFLILHLTLFELEKKNLESIFIYAAPFTLISYNETLSKSALLSPIFWIGR